MQIQRPRKPRHRTPSALEIRHLCNGMVLCAALVHMEKDFDRWNKIKKATDAADEAARLYFREGEVWWVRLGHNVGYEANGKSREFTRPVIILKKYNQYSFLALPLTTVPKPNPYRLPVGIVDGRQAFATLSQLRNQAEEPEPPLICAAHCLNISDDGHFEEICCRHPEVGPGVRPTATSATRSVGCCRGDCDCFCTNDLIVVDHSGAYLCGAIVRGRA